MYSLSRDGQRIAHAEKLTPSEYELLRTFVQGWKDAMGLQTSRGDCEEMDDDSKAQGPGDEEIMLLVEMLQTKPMVCQIASPTSDMFISHPEDPVHSCTRRHYILKWV